MFSPALFATLFTNVAFAPLQDQRDPLVDRQYALVRTLNDEPPVATSSQKLNTFGGFSPLFVQGQSTASTLPPQETRLTFDLPATIAPQVNLSKELMDIAVPFESFAPAMALDQSFLYAGGAVQKLPGMEKKVSANFNQATVGDVLKWVSKQGVSFVVNNDELKSKKITMNLNNVKLHDALNALAEAIGANWQVKGSMLILRPGFGGFTYSDSARSRTLMAPLNSDSIVREYRAQADALRGQGEIERFRSEKLRADSSKMREEAAKAREQAAKARDMAQKVRTEHHTKMVEMIKTLSPAQRELHKKQGYLKWSDLTPDQRKAMGIEKEPANDSNFSMVVRINDETWTFKGK